MLAATMMDHINFLRRNAVVLRDLARRAPQIAEALGRLADELDERANVLTIILRIRNVVVVADGVAVGCVLNALKGTRNPHFVQIGIS